MATRREAEEALRRLMGEDTMGYETAKEILASVVRRALEAEPFGVHAPQWIDNPFDLDADAIAIRKTELSPCPHVHKGCISNTTGSNVGCDCGLDQFVSDEAWHRKSRPGPVGTKMEIDEHGNVKGHTSGVGIEPLRDPK